MKRPKVSRLAATLVFVSSVTVLSPTLPFLFVSTLHGESQTRPQLLTNDDVIAMVKSGLSLKVIIEKIQHSAVSFDTSPAALVALKNAEVPDELMTLMISSPSRLPNSGAAGVGGLTLGREVDALDQINVVVVTAPSDVLRGSAERVLTALNGPRMNSPDGTYEAALEINVECGERTFSWMRKGMVVACTGSLAVQSGSKRLWATSSEYRASTDVQASQEIAERTTKAFVLAWRKARGLGAK